MPHPGKLLDVAQKLIPVYQSALKTQTFFTHTYGLKVAHAHLHLKPQNVTLSLSLSLSQLSHLLSTT